MTISPLQITGVKSFSGLVTENSLHALRLQSPQLASSTVTKVMGMLNGSYNLWDRIKKSESTLSSDNDFEWFLEGDSRRAINIVGFTAPDPTRPGIGNTPFLLELEEQYFQVPDLINFDDREYAVKIIGNGYANGTNWVYEVKPIAADPTNSLFIPPYLLDSGRQVAKEFSPVTHTMNDEYGGVQYSTPFKMRNCFSGLAKEYEIPGNMKNRKLFNGCENAIITFTAPDGSKHSVWTNYHELVFDYQWEMEKMTQLFYGKSTKNLQTGQVFDKSGNGFENRQGHGFREQIAPSNKYYYTKFDLKQLQEILMSLCVNTIPEDDRKFVILTGEWGMIDVHETIQDDVFGNQGSIGPDRTFGKGQNLGYGGQYRDYKFPNGIEVTFVNFQPYNDYVNNRLKHPDGGTVESRRMTILNMGTSNGEANVQIFYPKDRKEIRRYVPGMTSPFLGENAKLSEIHMAANKKDAYGVYYMAYQALMLKNPFSCAELICDVSE